MSDDQRMRDVLRPIARELLPSRQMRRQAAVFSAFDDAGNVNAEALRRALPPSWMQWYISGSLSAGTNVAAEIELPAPCRLTTLVVRVKTPPSGTCTVRLTVNGTEIVNVTVPISGTRGRAAVPSDVAERSAGEVLRIDVVSAGSAANATVLVAYTVAS